MYRIVKRIVHTITTVTWLVRLEDNSAEGRFVEKEITFPASVSVTEEEATGSNSSLEKNHQPSNAALDRERRAKPRQSPKRDQGEKS